jgi:HlyD family secretion protein
MLFIVLAGLVQNSEPAVSRDSISVHQIRQGTMPLLEMASASVISIAPPRVRLSFSTASRNSIRPDQTISVEFKPIVLRGKLVNVDRSDSQVTADVEFNEPFPAGTVVGQRIIGRPLVDVGEQANTVFFERPGDSVPNTKTTIFRIEPDNEHARRVPVEYGRQSGPLIEIVSGLMPGDRVIVTDMSPWAAYDRVQLK